MTNVQSFDNFNDDEQIIGHQLGLPRIVLEGTSDVELFREYWFPRFTEDFEFVSANELGCGNGCTAVERAVSLSRERDNIPAFGFIDRDWLFREQKWDALFAIDEAEFLAKTQDNDTIHITLLWEVEAYLLEPDLIPELARGHSARGFARGDGVVNPLGVALEELEHMLRAQRLFAVAHENNTGYGDKHFLDRDGDQIYPACEEELERFPAGHERGVEFEAMIDRILEAAPTTEPERIRYLLRYVNTKRFIHRLVRRLQLYPEIRGFLATVMHKAGRQPLELRQRLDYIRSLNS
jgi:hypothetical protein